MSERTFCTTECWDCYDTTCEHFIKGLEKDRENRQELREEIMILNNELYKLEGEKKFNEYQLQQEIDKLVDTIEDVNREFSQYKYENKKEIERLNNIINELEKYLIEEIEDYDKHINSRYITDIAREQYEGEKVCFEDTLGKLQELKGSDE